MKKIYFLLIFIFVGKVALSQIQTINVGTTANDGTGDPLRVAFIKVNQNFAYHQAQMALKASLSNPTFTGTVTLPSTTSIGNVSSTEISYIDGLTSNVQSQLYDTLSLSDVALLKHPSINAQTGTTYTLILTDDGKIVTCSNSSAITVTVPPNSSVAFPVGTQVTIIATGSGQVTIAAGSGVTINSAGGALKLRVQYSAATLIKTGTDTWLLIGDISTS